MAKGPKRRKDPIDDLQGELNALIARVDQLEEDLIELDSKAIKEDGTVTIRKTCHLTNVKVVHVSSKMVKAGASAVSRLKKMGK